MKTSDVCKKILNSIVAISPKYLKINKGEKPPIVPPIIGTGFIIDEDGLVVTCDHVIKEVLKLPKPNNIKSDDIPIRVFRFNTVERKEGNKYYTNVFKVLNIIGIDSFNYKTENYPNEKPDIGFLHIDASELKKIDLCENFLEIKPGIDIVTGGFPLSTYFLIGEEDKNGEKVNEWINQFNPIFQKGIISSVFPRVCKKPHGILTNMMIPEGGSGSPLVSAEDGKLIGIMSKRTFQYKYSEKGARYYIPTNFSTAISTYYFKQLIEIIKKDKNFFISKNISHLSEKIEAKKVKPIKPVDVFTWEYY